MRAIKTAAFRLTNSEKQEILSKYLRGEKASDIADQFNTSQNTVFLLLKKNGIQTRQAKQIQTVKRGESHRTCKDCGVHQPIENFKQSKRCLNGRAYICLPCNLARSVKATEASRLAFKASGVAELTCRQCSKVLPLKQFAATRHSATGYQPRCRQCIAETAWKNSDTVTITEKPCTSCKVVKSAFEFVVNRRMPGGLSAQCRDCRRITARAMHERRCEMIERWRKGEDEESLIREYSANGPVMLASPVRLLAHKYLRSAKTRAFASGASVTIDADWIIEKLRGSCEATGLPFDFSARKNPFSPSLDRVVAGGDYSPENVKVVVLCYNMAKNKWRHEDVVTMAEAIVSKRQSG